MDVSTLISTLGLFASQNLFLAYFIIYISTIFLGNISAFISFWVISQGYLGVWGVPSLLLTMFLANMTGDLLWYSLGKTLRNTRLGNWIKNHLRGHERIENILQRNGKKMLFFSKFMYGASFPVLFLIGWTKMEFKKFFRTSALSILMWLPIFLGLAYGLLSGLSPLLAVSVFKNFELAFFIGLTLFLVLDYLLAKAISRFIEKKEAAV